MTHGATQHMFNMKDVFELDEQSNLSRCCERGSQTDDSGGMTIIHASYEMRTSVAHELHD